MRKRDRGLPIGLALSGGSHMARADRGIVTFPASTPIRHDRDPVTDLEFDHDPDTLPSAHIVPAAARVPTPPDQINNAIVASILNSIGVEMAAMSANIRKLAARMAPKDGAA